MDIRALLLVSGGTAGNGEAPQAGSIAGVPFAFLDVLGSTVLERVAQRLNAAGISQISVLTSAGQEAKTFVEQACFAARVNSVMVTGEEYWPAAEEVCEEFRQAGADMVLVLRLGSYVEMDFEELIQHHIDKHCRMSSAVDARGRALEIFLLDAARRGDASALFRSKLERVRDDCERFKAKGYINPLRTAEDLRLLALDGLLEKNAIRPVGREIRPGVWVGARARIHGNARILAPAFIGVGAKIRAASLITRNSVVERHAEIDCGTVVENSTVLPYTYIGAGLDVMHSVVGFRRVCNLPLNAEVEISDARLVGSSPANTVSRTLGSAVALFAVLPKQVFRGFLGRVRKPRPAALPESLQAPAPKLGTPDGNEPASGQEVGEFPSSFAVARRYGEH